MQEQLERPVQGVYKPDRLHRWPLQCEGRPHRRFVQVCCSLLDLFGFVVNVFFWRSLRDFFLLSFNPFFACDAFK